MNSMLRRGIAAVGLAALLAGCTSTPAADPSDSSATTPGKLAVPTVKHVPRTADSYPFSAADHARVPVDLASHGFVEEEYFLSGNANVYTLADGTLAIEESDIPYTNRILVRRPSDPAKATGVVLVDIYNASNGYDIEDMWRRLYSNILLEGHTYVGVTSKPINVDALYQFDLERYQELSWYDEPETSCPRHELIDFATAGPWVDVPCTETGLAWDILTQVGTAIRDPQASEQILGDIDVKSVFLIGQSQSGTYLNTYVNNFHNQVTQDNGGTPVFDGYLTAAGNWLERSIRDGEYQNGGSAENNQTGMVPGPATPVDIDVPWMIVDSESDTALFQAQATKERALDEQTRVWQISGTGHTYSWSPVVPDNAELLKAGRPERVFPEVYTPYPMEPSMIAATQALINNHQNSTALPATKWFERDAEGNLVRDDNGNVLGGVRYGLMELALAKFLGFAKPGDMNGVAEPITAEQFQQRWSDRADYLSKQSEFDDTMIEAGYLTPDGKAIFAERANLVLDEIGIPA